MPVKPDTQKRQLEDVWDVLIGENGGGVKALAERNAVDINEIKTDVAYIRGSVDAHMGTEKPPRKKIILTRAIEMAVLALIVGGVILLAARVLLPSDLVDILNAAAALRGAG